MLETILSLFDQAVFNVGGFVESNVNAFNYASRVIGVLSILYTILVAWGGWRLVRMSYMGITRLLIPFLNFLGNRYVINPLKNRQERLAQEARDAKDKEMGILLEAMRTVARGVARDVVNQELDTRTAPVISCSEDEPVQMRPVIYDSGSEEDEIPVSDEDNEDGVEVSLTEYCCSDSCPSGCGAGESCCSQVQDNTEEEQEVVHQLQQKTLQNKGKPGDTVIRVSEEGCETRPLQKSGRKAWPLKGGLGKRD